MIHQSDCQVHSVDFDELGQHSRGDCTCFIKDVIDALYAEGDRRWRNDIVDAVPFDIVADWLVDDAL